MRNTGPRWRRLVDLVVVAVAAAFLRRRLARADATDADAGERDVSVELERVSLGDEISVATGGLDPTLAADVLELNEEAARLVDAAEEEFVREPIETATGGAVEVPDVEDELARRVRESDLSATAVEELEALGFRGMLGFGRRRDADAETDGGDEE